MKFRRSWCASAVAALVLGTASVVAEAVVVAPNGALAESTAALAVNNVLTLGSGSTGFSFSGATGSFLPTVSAGGYFYSAFLITTPASTAESVASTLTNSGGVSFLSERIYAYNPALGNNGFLGDTPVPGGALQAWSTDYPLPGASVSIISPTSLSAGSYVIELRGTTAGSFGGSISLTPVPEPETFALFAAGLAMLGVLVRRRAAI